MNEPSIHVSLSWKKQVRNYEPVEISVGVSGITASTTPDEIASLIDGQGKIAYDMLMPALTERMADAMHELRAANV